MVAVISTVSGGLLAGGDPASVTTSCATYVPFLSAMNVSNGCLVASLATDNDDFATRVSGQLQAFKVGVNKPRSRGDREEVFGGLGESWKGAFVGGDLLVQAVTMGPDGEAERLFGNFPDYSLYPTR